MSQREEKRIFIKQIRTIYNFSNRKFKSQVLDNICNEWNHNRKYAIRMLKLKLTEPKKPKGPKPKYEADILLHLKRIWLATDQMCSKKLKIKKCQVLTIDNKTT